MTWLQRMSISMLLEVLEAMDDVLAHDLDVSHVIPHGQHVLSDGSHLLHQVLHVVEHHR